ncbi:MAG: DNA polymerase III subunit gamma/tau [Thiohalophilus sp.]|uniref:DNA polymerase III subunit gamma/tau n=1 Tax=Thiohalophilus sp. TaxID=3028392 RepID=UPI0028708EC0|nr:DNA polymerase III subunit gamma/tau [Thiohalophilus sp.]MDR9437402.1 DNA polymerase III subunit gamma/tau [Thiohalophilus sp.]
MSYQVLARKWRPRTFDTLVGQEHVSRALINALDNDRVHHAFLFTGTRGVGKTTIARIFAKSLNCEQGVSSQPCGVCSACTEIDENRFVDLLEVDAASRTKVEDTRDLLDNVQYAPTRGRYKVYLIDEVHMLSGHSFNALLKTLEEPPPHVKFLLATTDPQKLPVTILSRCLQFNLRRLPAELIVQHLENVLQQEGIEFEVPALQQLARSADGSMRDALSLLDQAIAYGGGAVREVEVRAMLGKLDQQPVLALLDALADGDGQQVLEIVQQAIDIIPDYSEVLAELISLLHSLALLQQIPEAYHEGMGDQPALQALAQKLSPEDVQLYYQIALTGRRDLPLAPDPRSGLEMALLRMLAFRPVEAGEGGGPVAAKKPSADVPRPPPAKPAQADNSPAPVKPAPAEQDWSTIVGSLPLGGAVKQLAAHSVLLAREGNSLKLALDQTGAPLYTKERQASLQQQLSEYFGQPIKLSIEVGQVEGETPARREARERDERQSAAVEAIENDANVKNLMETFDARINTGSVEPID